MHSFCDRSYLKPNRYECALAAEDVFAGAFAGASRVIRLSSKEEDGHRRTIWDTAANVVGPLFAAYVWWLLRRAQKDGVQRLYFMARDGQVLKQIADILIPASGTQVETRYIHVSRQALLYPSIVDVDDFDVRWLMWNPLTSMTAGTILDRLEATGGEVQDALLRFCTGELDRPLSFLEKMKLRGFFLEPKVRASIRYKAEVRFASAMAYLRQEGFADGVPFALVDLGWAALSQYALSRMLDKSGCRPAGGVKGYYLGLNGLFRAYKNDTASAFLFDRSDLVRKISLVEYSLLETFAVADHGRTLGYAFSGERVKPILGDVSGASKAWGSDIQRVGILAFAKELVSVLPKGIMDNDPPMARVARTFHLFCNFPSRTEADTYGKFLHGADIEERHAQELSPVISLGGLPRVMKGYYWVQGSVARSGFILKGVIVGVFLLLNILRHALLALVFRAFFSLRGR